jgi:ABC-type phosphate transport system permease subunit
MSAPATPTAPAPAPPAGRPRRARRGNSLAAHGEPQVWLTGGGLAVAVVMIVGLLVLVLVQGLATFWPGEVVQIRTVAGNTYLGEVVRTETYRPEARVFDELPPEARARARAEVEQTGGVVRRRLLRTGNFDLTGTHHQWVSDFETAEETRPEWVLVVERLTSGNFYGTPAAFLVDGKVVADQPAAVWAKFNEFAPGVQERLARRVSIERHDVGELSRQENEARLAVRQAEIDYKKGSPEHAAAEKRFAEVQARARAEVERFNQEIAKLNRENDRYQMQLKTAQGQEHTLPLAQIVRAYPANRLGSGDKLGVYFSRWGEFLSERPRESNTEGGVFPAILGTLTMTLLMSLAVVPFGVLAALYLREYARSGPIISAVRVAINNLAGVPSVVFGVFGLGFFCYLVGPFLDGGPEQLKLQPWPEVEWWWTLARTVLVGVIAFLVGLAGGRPERRQSWTGRWLGRAAFLLWLASVVAVALLIVRTPYFHGFYQANLPNPTFGKGALLWASLTLALLTLPVVIVATEEALAAVPNSMREGSYACGASKWQTIRRIVLPRALPGIMTGMILAVARGAGEVAPLMMVGAVHLAAEPPVDATPPFLHPSRSFMHLGYHIYDVGFASPNSEAARPMVFTTTLLLIALVALLNLTAVWLRSRLRRRYLGHQF